MKRLFQILFLAMIMMAFKSCIPQKYRTVQADLWPRISLASPEEVPTYSDSMVVLYSVRNFHPDQRKFFGNYIDSSGMIRVLLAVCKNNRWKIYIRKNLDEAMTWLNRGQDLVCYVEGMGKDFPLTLERAMSMSAQYKVRVVMFDYPSINTDLKISRNFKFARISSSQASIGFSSWLKTMNDYKIQQKDWIKDQKRTLFHHSMGNIMIRKALLDGLADSLSSDLFDHVVLNAACVGQKKHKQWVEKITFSDHVLIHYNKQDRQLRGAGLLTFQSQLGAKFHRPLAENATYVDFNLLVGKLHTTFIDIDSRPPIAKEAKAYFHNLFHGKFPDFSDTTKFRIAPKNKGYTLMPLH